MQIMNLVQIWALNEPTDFGGADISMTEIFNENPLRFWSYKEKFAAILGPNFSINNFIKRPFLQFEPRGNFWQEIG